MKNTIKIKKLTWETISINPFDLIKTNHYLTIYFYYSHKLCIQKNSLFQVYILITSKNVYQINNVLKI